VPFWDDFARAWERQKKRKATAEAMAPITVAVATKVASREFMELKNMKTNTNWIWGKMQFQGSKCQMNYKINK